MTEEGLKTPNFRYVINCERSQSMEQMTEHLEVLAEKIMPRTIHITNAGTAIYLVDVGSQTDVDSCTLKIDVHEDGLDDTPAKGGTPKYTICQPGIEITSTDENVTIVRHKTIVIIIIIYRSIDVVILIII